MQLEESSLITLYNRTGKHPSLQNLNLRSRRLLEQEKPFFSKILIFRLQEREACKFFQQILAGVEYVHKLNIVHRDLKPENLLLDKNHNIKIVDFGLSNIYSKGGTLKTACGSPCYAAPEMIAGHPYHGLRVDIWSCGVILFAMICGYLPFDDQDTQILYKKIMSGDYQIPSHVSDEARDLLHRVLNTDPDQRYTIDEIRRHRWFSMYTKPLPQQGVIVGYHQIPIDEKVLQETESYGHDKETVRKYLVNNKHNKLTTLYYLLLLKSINAGHKSEADISSQDFRLKLLDGVEEKIHEPLDPEEARKRREIEALKQFKVQMDKDSKLNSKQKLNHKEKVEEQSQSNLSGKEVPNPITSDIMKKVIPTSGSNKRERDHVRISRGGGRKADEDPPSAIINQNHNIIEKRTRKPNIAKLNNTTMVSIDDGRSRGRRTPTGSISPINREEREKSEHVQRYNIQQKLISKKMKELSTVIPGEGPHRKPKYDFDMEFASGKTSESRQKTNKSITQQRRGSSKRKSSITNKTVDPTFKANTKCTLYTIL